MKRFPDMRKRAALAVAMMMALTAPVAASWGNDPVGEPSSEFDEPHFMWGTPNDASQLPIEDRIYFNVQVSAAEITTVPQLPGGRVPGVLLSAEALMGYWRDCNNDGYIGNGATGQTKYMEQTAIIDERVCPPGSAFNPRVGMAPSIIWGNVGPMIYELVAVTPFRGFLGNTPVIYALQDEQARVWGDFGRPSEQALASPATFPVPQGTWDSWNGHFDYADALVYGRLSDAYDALGTGPFSESPVNDLPSPLTRVRGLYGQESDERPEGRPLVALFTCDSPQEDPRLEPSVDPEGSVLDSVNNTMKGLNFEIPSTPPVTSGGRYQLGQACNDPNSNGVLVDGFGEQVKLEQPEAANTAEKTTTDWTFTPTPPLSEPRHQAWPWAHIRNNIGTGAWLSQDYALMDATGLREAHHFTFYAKVGGAGLTGKTDASPTFFAPGASALPGSRIVNGELAAPAFVYGEEACGGPDDLGWDCDAWPAGSAAWHTNKDEQWGVVAGETYQLRDTDCFDFTPAGGNAGNDAKDVANLAWGTALGAIFDPIPDAVGDRAFESYCE